MKLKLTHEIKSGCLLVSEPFLPDPHFKRTVILVVGYEDEGTLGFVLNKPSFTKLNEALHDDSFPAEGIWTGGPVQPDTLQWIHPYPQIQGSKKILEQVYWGGDFDEVKNGIHSGIYRASDFRFFAGYSGWSPGQLEEEISEGSWLITEGVSKMVFNPFRTQEDLWKKMMTLLGGDYAILAKAPEHPWLN